MAYAAFGERAPFGRRSAQQEKQALGDHYQDYFFHSAPFNRVALDKDRYLIVGRRGSGKSSIIQYFGFQRDMPKSRLISINQKNLYTAGLGTLERTLTLPPEIAVPQIADLWKITIWALIFRRLRNENSKFKKAMLFGGGSGSYADFTFDFLGRLSEKFLQGGGEFLAKIRDFLRTPAFAEAQEAALVAVRDRPIIIAVDSMERYTISDENVMRATAALVDAAAHFNSKYATAGIHVKIFLAGEIFPYLIEEYLLNPLKSVRDELWLHWRPKDLVRLICYRLHLYLREQGSRDLSDVEDWGSFSEVERKVWTPAFGDQLTNRTSVIEKTFPYVLRHTQLRPRQLIIMCNTIAKEAVDTFPVLGADRLVAGVREAELSLANEVINSYVQIYPHVGDVVASLSGMPVSFLGNELDLPAKRSATSWPAGDYSSTRFRRLVAELGIVGRVRKEASGSSGIVEADFEFTMKDRLFVNEKDQCVIHPMFYHKMNISGLPGYYIYPFPDHPDFLAVRPEV